MTRQQQRLLTILALIALALGFLISRRIWFRLDLSKNRAYTLSPISRNLHREITGQVRITYYISDPLRAAYPQPGEIEDLLREYAVRSRGKIRYTRRDPGKADLVPAMEDLGIPALEIETTARDQQTITVVYAGLLIEYLDWIAVLPVALSPSTLEYDLTSRILSLVRGIDREIGILIGDSFRTWEGDYAPLKEALSQAGFRVRPLAPGEEIPSALPALFIFGGAEELDEWALYRIDHYIQGGGRVFFAPETISINLQGNLEARYLMDQGLIAMLSWYGATVRPELTLDRSNLGGYPHWVGVLPENAHIRHPLTGSFDGLDLFWPSPIDLDPPPGVEVDPLFTSSPEAWLQTGNFVTIFGSGPLFEREAAETGGLKILGAALTGLFPSWFEGLPKPVRRGSGETLPDPPEERRPARIVVVGDADLASSLLEYTQGQRNLDFMIRIADWLENDEELSGLRLRQGRVGRLDRIFDPGKRAGVIRFARLLNLGIVPLAFICGGFLLARKRRASGTFRKKGEADEPKLDV